jgi:fumarylpyruvate hydrolase
LGGPFDYLSGEHLVSKEFVFSPTLQASMPVAGSNREFPVHRIYCVGKNYAEHAREMGSDPEREAPCFFTKPADAVHVTDQDVPYPRATENLHHEVELVVALGAGGRNLDAEQATSLVFGYAVGLDLTRRDLQAAAKKRGQPWDTAKGFDHSAPMSAIVPAQQVLDPARGRIWLEVNGELRQSADIADMTWSVAEIISHLSGLFDLCPGDLIFTGTPAGVGPLRPGDVARGGVQGVAEIEVRIGSAD